MKCQICGVEVTMPYTCPYCGGQFCGQHHLPENHTCPQINNAYTKRQYTTQQGSGYNYSYNFNQHQTTKNRKHNSTSQKEIKHLLIAALLVIGIGFSIGFYNNWNHVGMMTVFSVCMLASFLVHELAHKITAQKHGLWAEFRLTVWGTILTVISIFLPLKVIAPGAMMISGTATKKSILKISIAGPITNIIFATIFFTLSISLQSITTSTNALVYIFVLAIVGFINAFIAVFNLIPIGVFDGFKIFSVNKKTWAAIFIPSLILFLIGVLMLYG
ncbi:MAG: hypothetical protein FWH37_03185 [Candidatus Bathyarchaeota archaeon]|nr:hypothetical protein [Candidatus Termiticorpusculum sp.]